MGRLRRMGRLFNGSRVSVWNDEVNGEGECWWPQVLNVLIAVEMHT